MKVNNIEDIERYLQEQMTKDEQSLFEAKLENDPKLQVEVDRVEGLIKGVELKGKIDLLEQMNEWDKLIESDTNDAHDNTTLGITTHNHFGSKRILFMAAAAIVLLASALLNMFDEQTVTLTNKYDHFSSNRNITRGTVDKKANLQEDKAYNLYDIKEYELAAPLLMENYKTSANSKDLFFAALCYFYTGKETKANDLISRINLTEEQESYLKENNLLGN